MFVSEVYSQRTVTELQAACSRGLTGQRNAALLAVLRASGLRISEALALRVGDVFEHEGSVGLHVRCGKGRKERRVAVTQDGIEPLRTWQRARASLPGDVLFPTLAGGKLDTSYVRHLLPRLARKAGVTQRVHAHGLRHTHAFGLANAGVPVHVVQRQLGHSSLDTTGRYLDHLGASGVLDHVASVRLGGVA